MTEPVEHFVVVSREGETRAARRRMRRSLVQLHRSGPGQAVDVVPDSPSDDDFERLSDDEYVIVNDNELDGYSASGGGEASKAPGQVEAPEDVKQDAPAAPALGPEAAQAVAASGSQQVVESVVVVDGHQQLQQQQQQGEADKRLVGPGEPHGNDGNEDEDESDDESEESLIRAYTSRPRDPCLADFMSASQTKRFGVAQSRDRAHRRSGKGANSKSKPAPVPAPAPAPRPQPPVKQRPAEPLPEVAKCPVCNVAVMTERINRHVDECLSVRYLKEMRAD